MAVNQSQVDHIITAASEDDPEVKLQNLEREVDLIKTSIKRLLMDIRERMNELENPFTLVAAEGNGTQPGPSAKLNAEQEAQRTALDTREAELAARESRLEAAKEKNESGIKKDSPPAKSDSVTAYTEESKKILEDQMLAVFRSQAAAGQKTAPFPQTPLSLSSEKLRLQKVYKLFKWTQQSVRKIGHDRLEIILESYRAMGYITKESCEEIREISRLMPANLGEEHEVGPDEFVSELYALNRILAPDDTSLDRDMIEVMMEQRQNLPASAVKTGEERIVLPRAPVSVRKPALHKEKDEEWMNLPDRI
jgi:hypothetical protein